MTEPNPMVIYPYDLEEPIPLTIDENPTTIDENAQNITEGVPNAPNITVGTPRPRRRRGYPSDRQTRIMKIALKLAEINGYNEDLNVKRADGTFNTRSNLVKLLNISQTNARGTDGIPEIIRLLHLAKIDPNIIINENMKSRLLEMNNSQINSSRPPPPQNVSRTKEAFGSKIIKSAKRKRLDNGEHSSSKNWSIPFDSDS